MFRALILFIVLLFPLVAHAESNMDAGLYAPLPPEGSVFVRFIGAAPKEGSDQAKLNGKVLDYMDYKEVSSYFVVPKGKIKAELGPAAKEFEAREGGFYTLALVKPDTLELYEDAASDNRAKAQVIFYNFNSLPLGVKTDDGKIDVITAQNIGKSGSRQINPVKVNLAVYNSEKKTKTLEAISLERGRSYSIVSLPDGDSVVVRSSTNMTR